MGRSMGNSVTSSLALPQLWLPDLPVQVIGSVTMGGRMVQVGSGSGTDPREGAAFGYIYLYINIYI